VWDVEVGRDMMIGPALVNDAFEEVAIVLLAADHLAVERRLRGHVAERGEEVLFQLLLAFANVVGRLESSDRLPAGVELFLRLGLEPVIEGIPSRRRISGAKGESKEKERQRQQSHGSYSSRSQA